MDQRTPQPAFPLTRAMAALVATVAVLSGLAAWLLPIEPRVVAFVSLVAIVSGLVSLAPVAMLGRLGVMPTVYSYFAGTAGRVLLCLGMATLGIVRLDMGPVPVLLLMTGLYLPMLAIEAGMVGRYLWQKDALTAAGAAEAHS